MEDKQPLTLHTLINNQLKGMKMESNINISYQDINSEIEILRQKIEVLEQQKLAHSKKFDGLAEFDREMKRIKNDFFLTESEIFAYKSDQIEKWITEMSSKANPSFIHQNLKKHFEKIIVKEQKKEDKAAKKPKANNEDKPKLKVGAYRNPFTLELIEKKRRNPRELDEWLKEHGFSVVSLWLIKE